MSALPRGTRTRLKHSIAASPSIKVQGTLSLSPSFESDRPTSLIAVNTLDQQPRPSSVPMHLSNGSVLLDHTQTPGFPASGGQDVPTVASFASSPIVTATAFSDNESSVLSELEDGLEEGPDDNGDIVSRSTESESSSDSDSEAETERLEISPRKHRRLPSAAERDNDANSRNTDVIERVETSGVIIEPIAQLPGQDDEAIITEGLVIDGQKLTGNLLEDSITRSPSGLAGRKRKRTSSISADAPEIFSDSGHVSRGSTSVRRETRLLQPQKISIFNHEMAIADDEASEPLSDVSSGDEGPTGALLDPSIAGKEDLDPSSDEEGDASEVESGKITEEPGSGIATVTSEIGVERDEIVEPEAEEEEAEIAAKSEDELAKKKTAMDALMPIENLFAIFRDRLFDERLAQMNAELEVLHDPDTKHPDFLAMQQCLNVRRDEKIHLEQRTVFYKNQCLENTAIATRAQLHSQYYQSVRVIRERHTDNLNKLFSKIQRERRQLQSREPEFGYKFNPKRSTQIANQAAYNTEVSLLSGIARHVGFPAAPELPGARASEIDDDFRAMQIKPVGKPKPFVARLATSRADEAAAEEQFLEKNPWANPNHPAHQHAHLLERPISTSQLLRHPLALATPIAQRWLPDLHQQPGATPSTSNTAAVATSDPPSALASGPPYRASHGGSSPFEQHLPRSRDREPSHPTTTPSRFERPYKPKNMPPSTLSAASSQGETGVASSMSPATRHQQPLLTQPLSSLVHAVPELQHVGAVAESARVKDGTSRYSSPAGGLAREARFMAVT